MSDVLVTPGIAPWILEAPAREEPSLRLNNPALSQRLDALFDRQFRASRTSTRRVILNHAFKRAMDIAVAGCGLLLIWPMIMISAIATLLDSGRPVFYSQTRRVRFGRRVRIYKMRTLVVGADRNLDALFNIKNNGRFLNIAKAAKSYTRVGRWLERLWIVEVPQLWNVLKGEMSLVGNRPIPDYVVGVLGPTPEVAERFASPQGMTGYTQILGRDEVTDEERIALEYHYSRVFEEGDVFFEDLRIIGLTVLSYLGIGRRRTVRDFLKRNDTFCDPSHPCSALDSDPVQITPTLTSTLACPTCYEVGDSCDSSRCRQECVGSCAVGAIRMEHGRPVIADSCTACSECVFACPLRAIDKAPLQRSAHGLSCSHCGTEYPEHEGVYDLLPRNSTAKASPYFDFYDKEYVHDNPQMHLEDTDWKVRELRELFTSGDDYANLFDLGCGAGVLGQRIAAGLGIDHRTSSDWSSGILAFARKQDPNGVYIRSDAAYLPVRNGAYDLAMLIDVVEHQDQPDQVLRELARISRRLLLRTPLEDCGYERIRRRRKDTFRESSGHVVHFNPASIRERLGMNRLGVVRETVRHISWSHWRRVIWNKDLPRSSRLIAAARGGLRYVLPKFVYRRLFVTNYNALCESEFNRLQGPRAKPCAWPCDRNGGG